MIVCILSLGSCWREPRDGRPFVWNSSGVADLGGTRQRAKVRGQVRFDSRLYQQAVGTSRLRGSCWHAAPFSESMGFRGLALDRRASHRTSADWYLVSVTEQMIGSFDEASWDPQGTQLISLSHWKSAQQALLLARRDAWLRGSAGTAVFTPNSAAGDWAIRTW